MPFRVGHGVFLALLTVLFAGCVPFPAKAKIARTGDVQLPSPEVALSVLFSHDFSPETPKSLGREMVECVTRGLAEAVPEVRLVPEEEFYRAVFGLKPGEVLLRADTIGSLLARPDIRQRVGQSGLTYLILVGGATDHRNRRSEGWTITYNLGGGASSSTRHTQFTAWIFELASSAEVEVQAVAEGSQGVGAIVIGLPLVWGWVHRTETAACDALGAEVVRVIGGKPRDESR